MHFDYKYKKRQFANLKGRLGEYLAAVYLFFKGYRILAMRYKTNLGEIDIIAKRGNTIAIVEVKVRNNLDCAINAVSFVSRMRIQNCADVWLSRCEYASKLSVRFDLVAVVNCFKLVHITNIF